MANSYYNNSKVDGETMDAAVLEAIEDGFDAVDTDITALEASVAAIPTDGAWDLNGEDLTLDADADTYLHAASDDEIAMVIASTEIMRYTSTGARFFNTNAPDNNTQAGVAITNSTQKRIIANGGSTAAAVMQLGHQSVATGTYIIDFFEGGSTIGSIRNTGSSIGWYGTSDYRLKEVVGKLDGVETINRLAPLKYLWNKDQSLGYGFIAHELQEVIPHAVTGEKDGLDTDGKPLYQQIDTLQVIPVLVAAVQELDERLRDAEFRLGRVLGA